MPLNIGSTKNEPPSCWIPEMPIGEDQDADDGAPDIDAARLDGGRAEEGADQGGQQIFEPDIRLADAQLGGEQQPVNPAIRPEPTKTPIT